MILQRKNILLGVTGGIAAFKAAELASLLIQEGASVDVVMTEAAQKFISPLTFQTLVQRTVYTDLWIPYETKAEHIALAERIDLAIVAPATANTLAKLAHGIADNLLTCVLLATHAPLLVAPAMNEGMWQHPATQANIRLLEERGIERIGPVEGRLACGKVGVGRMADPATILERIRDRLSPLRRT